MTDDKTYTIDAAKRSLGRVASEAAKALMGKTRADYEPRLSSGVQVRVTNAAKIHLSEKKRAGKVYTSYSGYSSGLKNESLAHLIARKGSGEAVRRAVSRMLPRNSLKVSRMKNLIITE